MNVSLAELAHLIQANVIGDEKILVSKLSPIESIQAGSLVYADSSENLERIEESLAAAILVDQQISTSKKPLIQVGNGRKAFIQLLDYFYPAKEHVAAIHPTAVIAEGVSLGKNISIGPYVVIESGSAIGDNTRIKSHVSIGHNVKIGANCTIHPHVTLYDQCQIGQNVCIHASTVIGSDGFGYSFMEGKQVKIPHVGQVIIEDEVEIGANSVVDRATLGATVIGAGTKIDNLVQIAHSVKLGKHNILCAFTGIAGSTTSGDNVIFAANVGVSDHVRIDDGVVLGARTGVPPKKHLRAGNVYLGSPARPRDKAIEHEMSLTRIPLMRKNLKALSDKVSELDKRLLQSEDK